MLRVVIVDDEAPARARLARLLAAHADVQVVGHAADGPAALQEVAARQPDCLLLDVQMPGPSGLDVAASLPEPRPALVFVTAHGQYALPAFETAALDYLVKPVSPERLARALDRVRAQRSGRPGAVPQPPAHLLVPDARGRLCVLPVAHLTWLEAADNYVVLHTRPDEPAPLLLRRPLTALLADLGDGFARCHRSAAVALAQVASMGPVGEGSEALVHLHDGTSVRCSRTHRQALLARLAGLAGLAPSSVPGSPPGSPTVPR